MRKATVKSLALSSEVVVPITSEDKPELLDEVLTKWQQILNLAARVIGVPSGLITRLSEKQLEVFLTSETEDNIFKEDLKLDLGAGWYCESVAAQRKEMLIPNAHKIEEWKDNPSLPFNMMSYMGFPIFWPDGEVFGTFCMLDTKEHTYADQYRELLHSLRDIIQKDLLAAVEYDKVKQELEEKDSQIREVHHRVKNHFNLLLNSLSLMSFAEINENPKEILTEVQAKIFAISSIHDKLYHSLNIEDITLGEYLCELGGFITQNISQTEIRYNCSCDKITSSIDISLPCGLLLNELITNSIKYAFSENEDPKISLNVKMQDRGVNFTYKDNGCGIDCSSSDEKKDSLGMVLIKQMANKLDAEYKMYNDNGFIFDMTMPLSSFS